MFPEMFSRPPEPSKLPVQLPVEHIIYLLALVSQSDCEPHGTEVMMVLVDALQKHLKG